MKRAFTLLEFAHLCDFAARTQEAEDTRLGSPAELIAFAARYRSQAAGIEQDVPDPIGRSSQVHREVADLIDAAVTTIADTLRPLLDVAPVARD